MRNTWNFFFKIRCIFFAKASWKSRHPLIFYRRLLNGEKFCQSSIMSPPYPSNFFARFHFATKTVNKGVCYWTFFSRTNQVKNSHTGSVNSVRDASGEREKTFYCNKVNIRLSKLAPLPPNNRDLFVSPKKPGNILLACSLHFEPSQLKYICLPQKGGTGLRCSSASWMSWPTFYSPVTTAAKIPKSFACEYSWLFHSQFLALLHSYITQV